MTKRVLVLNNDEFWRRLIQTQKNPNTGTKYVGPSDKLIPLLNLKFGVRLYHVLLNRENLVIIMIYWSICLIPPYVHSCNQGTLHALIRLMKSVISENCVRSLKQRLTAIMCFYVTHVIILFACEITSFAEANQIHNVSHNEKGSWWYCNNSSLQLPHKCCATF